MHKVVAWKYVQGIQEGTYGKTEWYLACTLFLYTRLETLHIKTNNDPCKMAADDCVLFWASCS